MTPTEQDNELREKSSLDEILANMFLRASSLSPVNFKELVIEDTKREIKLHLLELIEDTARELSKPPRTNGVTRGLVELKRKVISL